MERTHCVYIWEDCSPESYVFSFWTLLLSPAFTNISQKSNLENPTQKYMGRLTMAAFILENPYPVAKIKRISKKNHS